MPNNVHIFNTFMFYDKELSDKRVAKHMGHANIIFLKIEWFMNTI